MNLADGVYAAVVELEDGTRHRAAVSVGRRPHYYEVGERLLEAYLLDFDGDLYGETVRVGSGCPPAGPAQLWERGILVEQIRSDVQEIRALQG